MKLLPLRYLGAALVLLAAAPAACTGDDPVLSEAGPVDGADASAPDVASSSSTDSAVLDDAKTPACKAPLADCNGDGTCDTSLDTDPKSCGLCGHDCGGGTCTAGKCQPQTVMDKLTGAVSLAVNATALVVLAAGGPRVCAKSGCGGAASSALANGETIASGPHTLYVDGQNAYWLGLAAPGTQYQLRKCAVAGCGVAPTVADDGQLGNELHGEGNVVLRYDPTGGVTKITLDGSAAKQYFTVGTVAQSLYFTLAGGKMAFSNSDGATGGNRGVWYGDFANVAPTRLMNDGRYVAIAKGVVYASRTADPTYDAIYSCPVAGCGGVGTPLGGTGPGIGTGKIQDMTADASGLYWVERIGTVGRIMRCELPGCPNGPEVLAASQDAPVAIVADDAFVYWVNAGSGGAANGTVARVAK
jgi:hypothetical protein